MLAFLLMSLPLACNAANVDYLMIKMMQPKKVVEQKTGSIDEMARYIKEVEVDINTRLSGVASNAAWGFLVVAVRDDGKIKAWIDTDDRIPESVSSSMVAVAQNARSFPVKSGAVVFALGFGIDGAGLPPNTLPFPVEWKQTTHCNNEDCADLDVEKIVLDTWD